MFDILAHITDFSLHQSLSASHIAIHAGRITFKGETFWHVNRNMFQHIPFKNQKQNWGVGGKKQKQLKTTLHFICFSCSLHKQRSTGPQAAGPEASELPQVFEVKRLGGGFCGFLGGWWFCFGVFFVFLEFCLLIWGCLRLWFISGLHYMKIVQSYKHCACSSFRSIQRPPLAGRVREPFAQRRPRRLHQSLGERNPRDGASWIAAVERWVLGGLTLWDVCLGVWKIEI